MVKRFLDDPEEKNWLGKKWDVKVKNFLKKLEVNFVKIHELKIDPEFFPMVQNGRLKCQIRNNDRKFEAGDILYLRETKANAVQMAAGATLEYTGRSKNFHAAYIIDDNMPGLETGYCLIILT